MRSTLRLTLMTMVVAVSAIAVPAGQAQPKPPARKAPEPALAPVTVDADLACSFSIDGESQGDLPANGSKTFELAAGEHVLRAVSSDDPTIIWRQIVEVAGQRKAVLIELAPLLERKRAAEAEKVKAEQQLRAEAERKAADAERARLEEARLADQARREKAASDQRAADAERVRREAARVEAEKATAIDAERARADDGQRFSLALLARGWKQSVPFSVSAMTEGGLPILRISGPDARATLAMVERAAQQAFRFEVQHSHGRDNAGFLYITKTTIAFDPIQPQYKEDAFDIPRTSVEKLKIDSDSPRVEFEGAGRDHRFVFLAEEIAAPTRVAGNPKARSLQGFGVLGPRRAATGQRSSTGATGVAMLEWFKAVMLDFDAAQKAFERQTADLRPPKS